MITKTYTDALFARTIDPPILESILDLHSELEVNFWWQWDNNPPSCYEALGKTVDTDYRGALARLKDGQSHNHHVQALYDAGYEAFGSQFYFILAKASLSPPDFAECRRHLQWELENNPQALVDAKTDWEINDQHPNLTLARLAAIYHLILGQRQSPSVMDLYRSCFRTDESQLRHIVVELIG